jgi:hypothetical protein
MRLARIVITRGDAPLPPRYSPALLVACWLASLAALGLALAAWSM